MCIRDRYKTYHAFKPEIERRYAQLRKENIFSVDGLYNLAESVIKDIPEEAWEAEKVRWEKEGRLSLEETNMTQIMSWFEKRLKMLDVHFNYNSNS